MIDKVALFFIACSVFAAPANGNAADKIDAKTYPGFTVFDKNGEYIKCVGPTYGRVQSHFEKYPPFSIATKTSFVIKYTPSVDIISFYINGTILYNGSPIYTYDSEADLCAPGSVPCPFEAGKTLLYPRSVFFAELGLSPGIYKGYLQAFTLSASNEQLPLVGLAFQLNLREK